MNGPELIGIDVASASITAVNVYVMTKTRKLRKEIRDNNRGATADRSDTRASEGAGGGASVSLTSRAEEGTTARLEIVDQPDPIRAWKSISLGADEHTVYLRSHHTQGPIALESLASCSQRYYSYSDRRPPHGAVPELTCSCGWYAVKDRAKLKELGYDGFVMAEVDLYGTVIEAEHGYRAEWQRILALRIRRGYCRGAFMCEGTPDLIDFPWSEETLWNGGSTPTVSKVRHPVPVCREHAGDSAVELSRIASRLGVEVRWDEGRDRQ